MIQKAAKQGQDEDDDEEEFNEDDEEENEESGANESKGKKLKMSNLAKLVCSTRDIAN